MNVKFEALKVDINRELAEYEQATVDFEKWLTDWRARKAPKRGFRSKSRGAEQPAE